MVILDDGQEPEHKILNSLYVVFAGAGLQRGYTDDSHQGVNSSFDTFDAPYRKWMEERRRPSPSIPGRLGLRHIHLE